MSYAGPSDLKARYDARTLGDLCGDVGRRVQPEQLFQDPNLQTALEDASGDIDAALLQGERYAHGDLDGLQGQSLSKLKRVCCDIAMGYLWERRSWTGKTQQEPHPAMARGQAALERLRKGENVFNLGTLDEPGSAGEAGLPDQVAFSRCHAITRETRNYYPHARHPR